MSSVEGAQRAARARAYLDSDPEVRDAIRATKAYGALLLMVPVDIRDHYTAEILCAARTVLDARRVTLDPELGSDV